MKRLTYYILFFVSYLPLFLILFIQNLDTKKLNCSFKEICLNNIYSIVLLSLSLLSLGGAWIFSKQLKNYGFATPKKIKKVKNTGVEYLTYLGTYIIPFVGVHFDTINNTIATIILIALIAAIYPKTNLIYANPTVALFNYNIYKVVLEGDDDDEIIIITREIIKKGSNYRLRHITDDIHYAIKT